MIRQQSHVHVRCLMKSQQEFFFFLKPEHKGQGVRVWPDIS